MAKISAHPRKQDASGAVDFRTIQRQFRCELHYPSSSAAHGCVTAGNLCTSCRHAIIVYINGVKCLQNHDNCDPTFVSYALYD